MCANDLKSLSQPRVMHYHRYVRRINRRIQFISFLSFTGEFIHVIARPHIAHSIFAKNLAQVPELQSLSVAPRFRRRPHGNVMEVQWHFLFMRPGIAVWSNGFAKICARVVVGARPACASLASLAAGVIAVVPAAPAVVTFVVAVARTVASAAAVVVCLAAVPPAAAFGPAVASEPVCALSVSLDAGIVVAVEAVAIIFLRALVLRSTLHGLPALLVKELEPDEIGLGRVCRHRKVMQPQRCQSILKMNT